jgi:hypothetical protein
MYIYEIVKRRQFVKTKLENVDNFIHKLETVSINDKAQYYNKALDLKFKLLNKLRSHDTLLQEQNLNHLVTIGQEQLTVYDAVQLRKTINIKIRTLDTIIAKGDFTVINIFSLIEQRDQLFEEFTLLDTAILKSDLTEFWEN